MTDITDTIDFTRGKMAAALVALALPLASCTDPAVEEDPVEAAAVYDGDWITVDGSVVSAAPESFVLDYGADEIIVEVDDWGFYQEGAALLPGDRVVVTGRVDENLFAADTIEASSVFVENLDTTFYASATDEEAFATAVGPTVSPTPGVEYTGWVTGTSQDSFTLGSGPTLINVDVSQLETSPLESGRIETGDRVTVWGEFEFGPDAASRVVADGVIELTLDTAATATGAPEGGTSEAGTPAAGTPASEQTPS